MSNSVRPPEGLRKIAKSAVEEFVETWNGEFGDFTGAISDAVLAALFDACEVRERLGYPLDVCGRGGADGVVDEPG